MQLVFNVLYTASTVLLMAVGFSLIFTVTRFFHFAHGISFISAPYMVFILSFRGGVPLSVSIPVALAASMLLGCAMELGVYRPLRRKGAGSLVLLLASLGLYIVLQNAFSMMFGDETRTLGVDSLRQGIAIGSVRITVIQAVTVFTVWVSVSAFALFLRKTKIGKAMRSVASDPVLSEVCGVNCDRVFLWTFAVGSGVAGITGTLVALDIDITPTMGMTALMPAVVAVVIGGIGNTFGIVLGSLLIASVQHAGIWYIGSQWQDAMVFVVLAAFLLWRPEGFFGRKSIQTTV